jgi:hypothetical protein
MAANENLPFAVGETYYNGDTPPTTVADRGIINLLGAEFWVPDVVPSTGVARSARWRKLRVVENYSGVTLSPKRLVKLNANGDKIIGYAAIANAVNCFPLDEYVTQVLDGDRCYIVVQGPATCLTNLAQTNDNIIAAGSMVVAATYNGTTHANAGRISIIDMTGATEPLAAAILGIRGRAMTAIATSNQTSTACLVEINPVGG